MTRRTQPYSLLALAAVVAIALGILVLAPGDHLGGRQRRRFGKARTQPTSRPPSITPYFPSPISRRSSSRAQETDPETGETVTVSLVSTVLPRSAHIAGIDVLVLEESAYEDGELIERALDFFAQHEDGTVYYFGEKVDNYVDGKVADHDGSWLAGKDGAELGIIMPAAPFVGQTFNQENAPGVAEDQAEILALNESVSTPAGNFTAASRQRTPARLIQGW